MHTRLPGLRQGTTVCVHSSMDMEQQSDHKLITPSGMGLLFCGAGSHPLVTLVCKGECANGSEPEPVLRFRIMYPFCSGHRISPGHSVVFQVRRVPGDVPSSITLDHGDLLVMDGSAQSKCAHRTASELQGPRVNLAFRWVTQHAASCPLAGVVGCVLPTCVQGLAHPGSRELGIGEHKWSSFWGLVFLLLVLVSFLLVSTWIHIRGRLHHSCRRPSHLALHFPSRGRARWVGRTALATVTTLPVSKKKVFLFPLCTFLGEKTVLLFQGCGFLFLCTAEYVND